MYAPLIPLAELPAEDFRQRTPDGCVPVYFVIDRTDGPMSLLEASGLRAAVRAYTRQVLEAPESADWIGRKYWPRCCAAARWYG